tara:strand:- start:2385 stop:2954 length:570 start_codon:yes stop_codon:yes gene_type:complete
MKVALFGGTFDPIHNGHINAAREILKQGLVEEVWFIPVYWHAFKASNGVSPLEHRKKMIELAIAEIKGLKVLDLNENPTYTLDTILKVKKRFPDNEYFWLMGTDLVEEFSQWQTPEKILEEIKLMLFPVPGSEQLQNDFINESNSIRVEAEEIDLSSTIVREKMRSSKPISKLVCPAVEQYIEDVGLYK